MKDPRIIVFDIESNGFPAKSLAPNDLRQPHVVQLAALQYNLESKRIEQSMCLVSRPDEWYITEETTAVHGITNDYAELNGADEELVVKAFLNLWIGEGEGLRAVAHNFSFDSAMISIALARFFPHMQSFWEGTQSFCTQKQSRDVVKALAKNGRVKAPRLEEAYQHFFNEPLDSAHTANGDTIACLKIYLALQTLDS
jgi:DNA polymerase-3 subunit epsilon